MLFHSVKKRLIIWRTVCGTIRVISYKYCNPLLTLRVASFLLSSIDCDTRTQVGCSNPLPILRRFTSIFYRSNNSNVALNSVPYIDPEYYISIFLSWLPRLRFGIPVRLFHGCSKPGLLYIFRIKRNFNLRFFIDTASFCRYFMIRSTWNTVKTMLLHGNIILI